MVSPPTCCCCCCNQKVYPGIIGSRACVLVRICSEFQSKETMLVESTRPLSLSLLYCMKQKVQSKSLSLNLYISTYFPTAKIYLLVHSAQIPKLPGKKKSHIRSLGPCAYRRASDGGVDGGVCVLRCARCAYDIVRWRDDLVLCLHLTTQTIRMLSVCDIRASSYSPLPPGSPSPHHLFCFSFFPHPWYFFIMFVRFRSERRVRLK